MKLESMEAEYHDRWPRPQAMVPDRTEGDRIYRACESRPMRCPDQPDVFEELWREASDWDDFLQSVKTDRRLRFSSQGWAEIARAEWWPALAAVDEKADFESYRTSADQGGVLLASPECTCGVLIPNGYGDGKVWVIVCEPGDANTDAFERGPLLKGTWRIMGYDCDKLMEDDDVTVVSGTISTYYADGVVLLVRRKR